MLRRKRSGILLFVTLAALILIWALWPRRFALALYTSPPVTIKQNTFRLQALVPGGWRPGTRTVSMQTVSSSKSGPVGSSFVTLVIEGSRQGPHWIPEWLRARLWGTDDGRVLIYGEVPPQAPFTPRQTYRWSQGQEWLAARTIGGPGLFAIVYSRQNRPAFEATYHRICDSFRVVR
jgi:hypothetical protein